MYASSFDIVSGTYKQELINTNQFLIKAKQIVFIFKYEYVSEWIDIYEEIENCVYFVNHEFKHSAVTIYNNI